MAPKKTTTWMGVRAALAGALLAVATLAGSPASAAGCPGGWSIVAGQEENGVSLCERTNADGQVEQKRADDIAPPGAADENDQTAAVRMFYYSMGLNASGEDTGESFCLTCDYMALTISALATFSASLFTFFQTFFVALAPVALAAWVGIWVIRLSMNGGEGAREFYKEFAKKLGLFFVLWGLLFNGFGLMGPHLPGTGSTGATYYAGSAWHTLGPETMRLSFALSGEIRTGLADHLMALTGKSVDSRPFQCLGLADRVSAFVRNESLDPMVQAITQSGCIVERVHALGMAAGVGQALSAWGNVSYNGEGFGSAVLASLAALLLSVMYFLGAIWFVFALLGVAVRGLFVAAFSPLLAIAALFEGTRPMAVQGFKDLIGIPVVAVSVAFCAMLGFFLILEVPTVYENTRVAFGADFNATLLPLEASGAIPQFAEMLERSQLAWSDPKWIPFSISSPWTTYLLIIGAFLFPVGRGTKSKVEAFFGVQSTNEMGASMRALAMKGAAIGAGSLALSTALFAAPVAGVAGAAGAKAGGMASGKIGAMANSAGSKMGNGVQAVGGLAKKLSPFGGRGNGEDGQ